MQTDDTDTSSPVREKNTAKSCCLLTLAFGLACILLLTAGIACVIIVDTINLKVEEHTLSWRVERYKVACQFLWFDFKDWISRKESGSSPSEPEIVPCPADPPEFESEPETEPQTP